MIPKFTIRQMLLGMVFLAPIFVVLGLASEGSVIAYGLSVAILGLCIPIVVYPVFYWVVRLASGSGSDSEEYRSPAFGPDELAK